MLTQNPSKILKSDFSFWEKVGNSAVRNIIQNEENCGTLQKAEEIVVYEKGSFRLEITENQHYFLLLLYGKLQLKEFNITLKAGTSVRFSSKKFNKLSLKNNLDDEQADFLLFTFNEDQQDDFFMADSFFINHQNDLVMVEKNNNFRAVIGLYEGRNEDIYTSEKIENTLFTIVLNGAFEFQNRLLENRDALLLWENEDAEFEALSENALILILELAT